MQLPLGLFGVALGTVTLPLLSRLVAVGNLPAFRGELARGMRLAFLMTIPCTVGLIMLAEPIVSVLYQHGRFDAYQTAQAAGALRYYAIGLAGYAALKVLINAFYALDQRRTPMYISFFAVALNLLLNWIFTRQLGWGHRGLAFSTGCVATCNFLVLYALMHHHLKRLETRRMSTLMIKVLLASAGLALVCWSAQHWLLVDWAHLTFAARLTTLLLTIVVGILSFVGCGMALRIDELRELMGALQRRARRI
jgi:putative peptidoglycan lipid II flippase